MHSKANSYEQKAVLIGVLWQFSCDLLLLLTITIKSVLLLVLLPVTRISTGAQVLRQSSNVVAFSFELFRLDGKKQGRMAKCTAKKIPTLVGISLEFLGTISYGES